MYISRIKVKFTTNIYYYAYLILVKLVLNARHKPQGVSGVLKSILFSTYVKDMMECYVASNEGTCDECWRYEV